MSHSKNNYSFAFNDFKLIEVNFGINHNLNSDKEEIAINTKLTIRHEWVDEEKLLKVFERIEISGDESPLMLSIEGGGLFKFENHPDLNLIEQIACVNCAALLFPYLRETVSDFIRRAGFPPLYLPPFNFVEAYHHKKQQEAGKTLTEKK